MKLLDRLLKKEQKDTKKEEAAATESETVEAVSPFVVAEPDEEPPEVEAAAVSETAVSGEPEYETDAAELTENFLLGLLSHLGVSADVVILEPEPGIMNVSFSGSGDYGRLIGRRGETLDAIQRITNTVVNRDTARHIHIRVDAGDYHAKREETVKGQAKRTASRVLKLRRSITMEPMNAFERHVVHETLQDFGGVTTYSTGTEPHRCVVVSYGTGKGGNRNGSR
ncbi:MAG: KH domain-containing protein [Oscillospiraceae bacterium]|jgi:spoIIIJ-associated protein|nr:KH domain-containing protein [Oscillospiraceae bacterium]